jgi:hypothetical protein
MNEETESWEVKKLVLNQSNWTYWDNLMLCKHYLFSLRKRTQVLSSISVLFVIDHASGVLKCSPPFLYVVDFRNLSFHFPMSLVTFFFPLRNVKFKKKKDF